VHIHVVPINSPDQLSFANVDRSPAPEAMEDAAERIRSRLREMGRVEADQ
jgi:histidine triad (HIT) family protein